MGKKYVSLTLGQAVILLLCGLLLGTIFTFGMQFWNDSVERKDAVSVEATYVSYVKDYGKRTGSRSKINQVFLYFSDCERLCIDGASASSELFEKLDALSYKTKLHLLVHPNSDSVLEIRTDEGTILAFEDAMTDLTSEKNGFFILGIVMYGFAAWGLTSFVLHGVYRKKQK